MNVNLLEKKLRNLVDSVNLQFTSPKIEFAQQNVKKENMRVVGGNGRMFIQPFKDEYDISLSGNALEEELYEFMRRLCDKECDGFKQTRPKENKKWQPYWRVDDFNIVIKAVERYSKTTK